MASYSADVNVTDTNPLRPAPERDAFIRVRTSGADTTLSLPFSSGVHLNRQQLINLVNALMDAAHVADDNRQNVGF